MLPVRLLLATALSLSTLSLAAICDGSITDTSTAALMGAVTGAGTLVTTGSSSTPKVQVSSTAMTISDPTLVAGRVFTECVYTAEVAFATSTAYFKTGPPGASASANYSCWSFGTTTTSGVTSVAWKQWNLGTSGSKCTSTNAFVNAPANFSGTISSYSSTDSVTLTCSATALSALAGVAMTGLDSLGRGVAVSDASNSTNITYVAPTGTFPGALATQCITAAVTTDAGAAVKATLASGACVYMKPSYVAGVLAVVFDSCSLTAFPATSASLQSYSATFFYPAASSGPQVTVPTQALVTASKAAATFSFTLSGSTCLGNVNNALNPCALVAIRQAYASALGIALSNMVITGLTIGTSAYTLSSTSSGNLATGVCAAATTTCSARRELAGLATGRALQTSSSTYSAGAVGVSASAVPTTLAPSMTAVASAMGATTLATSAPAGVAAGAVTVTAQAVVTRVKPYEPNGLIVLFHSLPRYGGATTTFALPAGFSFSTDALLAQSKSYLGGAVVPGLALIVVGVVMGVIYICAYCFGCCRCCRGQKCRRDRAAYFKGARRYCGPALAMGIMAFINLGLIFSVIAYTPNFGAGITALVTAVADVKALITSAASILGTSTTAAQFVYTKIDGTRVTVIPISTSLATAAASATNASTYAKTAPAAVSAIQTLLATVSTALTAASSASSSAATPLTEVVKTLDGGIPTSLLTSLQSTIGMATLGALGAIAAVIFLQSAMVCKNWFACCMFKSFSLPAIILTMLVFILAGVFYIIAIIGSDVCFSPNATLASLLGTGTDMGSLTLQYYLKCATTPMDVQGALTFVGTAGALIGTAATQTGNLRDQYYAASSSTLSAAYGSLLAANRTGDGLDLLGKVAVSMSNASSAIALVGSDTLSCAAIDAIFSQIWTGLCNGTVASAAGIARILIAASVLLLIQLGIGIDLCCYQCVCGCVRLGRARTGCASLARPNPPLRPRTGPASLTPSLAPLLSVSPQPGRLEELDGRQRARRVAREPREQRRQVGRVMMNRVGVSCHVGGARLLALRSS